MLHIESSLTSIGIENLEFRVLSPGNNKDAIPLDATIFKAISPLDPKAAESNFHKNVFPVLP